MNIKNVVLLFSSVFIATPAAKAMEPTASQFSPHEMKKEITRYAEKYPTNGDIQKIAKLNNTVWELHHVRKNLIAIRARVCWYEHQAILTTPVTQEDLDMSVDPSPSDSQGQANHKIRIGQLLIIARSSGKYAYAIKVDDLDTYGFHGIVTVTKHSDANHTVLKDVLFIHPSLIKIVQDK